MIKKIFYTLLITIATLLLKSNNIYAKEYCNIFENNNFKETVELPFYFYEITLTIDFSYSMPLLLYDYTYIKIDSTTKCEEINTITKTEKNKTSEILTVYDYSNKLYNNITTENFENAKFIELGTKIKGYSTIIDQEPPYFEGNKETYKTNIDNPINLDLLLTTISAYDKRDGNITKKIEIIYTEYNHTNKKTGSYPVILSVKDTAENKTTITFYIEMVDTTPPQISGNKNYTSYLSNPLSIEEIKNNMLATDNTNIDLTSQIYVCDDNYSKNNNKTGIYSLYFCVYDTSQNPSMPYEVSIEVKDDIPPIIEGLNYYTSYLSNPISIKQIMYSLAASDDGKDISSSIFMTDDYYSTYINTIGEKSIYFQAMDDSNNLSQIFKVTINLIDDIPPQIFGLNTFTSNLSSPLSLTYLKNQLSIIDNLDGTINHTLEIIEDDYTNNINKKGNYSITFQAKDYSNNLSETFNIKITNIDDVSPTINGPESLTYSLKAKPLLSEILSEFNAKDNLDDNLEIEICNDSYSNSITTGTYYLQLKVTDTSSNQSPIFTTKINIVEAILNLNQISLYIPTSNILQIQEINNLINLNEEYTILENTYTPNYSIEGTYKIQYKLKNNQKIILNITTYTPQTIKQENKETQKKETFSSKIKGFFKNILTKIKNFFKNLNIKYIFLKF